MRARWTRLALEAPSARSSHKLSAINGKAYLYGGEETARHAISSVVHCLGKDDRSGSWKWRKLEPPSSVRPPARVGHAQAVAQTASGEKLLIFGGRAGVEMGEHELGDLWSFEPPSEEHPEGLWTELKAPSAPSPRSFHAATAVGSTMFVFGGCGADGRMADLHAYDASENNWTALPPPPPDVVGRGGATLEATAAAADDDSDYGLLWLACGFVGHGTNDLLRFCLRSGAWERAPSDGWLRPRSVAASFTFPRGLFILFGGEVSPSDRGHEGAGGFAGDLLAIDARSGSPKDLAIVDAEGGESDNEAPAPAPRGWAAATALSDSQGVLFGGLTGSDDAPKRLGDTWLLDLLP